MKQLLTVTLTVVLPLTAGAAPGLIGEYFKLTEKLGDEFEVPVNQEPWLVRVDQQVDFPEVQGDFYGSKLDDRFMVRWRGLHRELDGARRQGTSDSRFGAFP